MVTSLEEEYCQLHISQLQSMEELWNTLPPSSKEFLRQLNLPMVNPFCNEHYVNEGSTTLSSPWMMMMDNLTVPTTISTSTSAPSMGSVSMIPTILDFQNEPIESFITFCYMTLPSILGLICLWIRLLSAYIAPIGVLYLLKWKYNDYFGGVGRQSTQCHSAVLPPKRRYMIATVVSSLIIMVDAQYVLEYDHPYYGIFLFVTSCNLVLSICRSNNSNNSNNIIHHKNHNHHHASRHFRFTRTIVEILIMVALYLTVDDIKTMKYHFGHVGDDVPTVSEGIYYDTTNPYMERVIQDNPTWPAESRVYDYQHGATPWMVTGDSRTGLPYLFNNVPTPTYHRVWLPTLEEDDDSEYLALDISFPTNGNGHDPTKPLYLIFHGLNGGSNDGYVQDITVRRNQEGSTVVVMIARGIMDTPIRGWTVRTSYILWVWFWPQCKKVLTRLFCVCIFSSFMVHVLLMRIGRQRI